MAKTKDKTEEVDPRRERWEAWLKDAREQRLDKTIFDEQRARGEFNEIPDWIK